MCVVSSVFLFATIGRVRCSVPVFFCFRLIVEIKKNEIKDNNRNQNNDIRVLCFSLHLKTNQGQGTNHTTKTNHITKNTNTRQSTNNKNKQHDQEQNKNTKGENINKEHKPRTKNTLEFKDQVQNNEQA